MTDTELLEAITLKIETDGLAWLTIDVPGKLNVLSSAVMMRLAELLAEIERAATAGRIKGLIVRSGKEGSFIAGADISEISAITDPAEGEQKAALGQSVFTKLARLPIPTVAAIDGVCLGGG